MTLHADAKLNIACKCFKYVQFQYTNSKYIRNTKEYMQLGSGIVYSIHILRLNYLIQTSPGIIYVNMYYV